MKILFFTSNYLLKSVRFSQSIFCSALIAENLYWNFHFFFFHQIHFQPFITRRYSYNYEIDNLHNNSIQTSGEAEVSIYIKMTSYRNENHTLSTINKSDLKKSIFDIDLYDMCHTSHWTITPYITRNEKKKSDITFIVQFFVQRSSELTSQLYDHSSTNEIDFFFVQY